MEMIAKRLMPGRVLDNPQDAVNLVRDVFSSWSDMGNMLAGRI